MNLESAIKYLVLASLLYVIFRSLAPGLFEAFKEKFLGIKSKDNFQEFDDMIRRKQDILRQQNLSTDASKGHSASITDLYKNHSQEKIRQTYELISELQWGESQTFERWVNEINYRNGLGLSFKEIFTLLKGIFYGQNAQLFNHPLSLDQVHQLVLFLCEMKAKSEGIHPDFESWQQTHQIKKEHIQKSLRYLSQRPHAQKTLSEEIVKVSSPKKEELHDALIILSSHDLSEDKEFDTRVKELAIVFALLELTPYAEKKNRLSLNEALKIFHFSKLPTESQLKQIRRGLIKSRHPDKLAQLNLSSKLEKIATQSYQVIESAHRIILEEIHKE